MSRAILLACFYMAVVICGCTKPAIPVQRSDKPQIIATFSVLDDLVRQVAGDHVDLVTLVGPDGDAHVFNPTPQDIVAISRAVVVFEVGANFETDWFEKAFRSSRSKAKRVVVSDGLELLEGECHHKPGEKPEPGHVHELDPHLWHDVANVIHFVGRIRDELCDIDPKNATVYRMNADVYLSKLKTLDAEIFGAVKTLPTDRRKLVTSHDTFGYFARRYGFQVVGSVLSSFSTETADPSVAEFAELVVKVKAQHVPAIFCETSHNSKLAERLATATGVRIAPPLYTDALGPKGSPGETYLGMMRHNVATIVAALAP